MACPMPAFEDTALMTAILCSAPLHASALPPVSYTHLDVYKRQPAHRKGYIPAGSFHSLKSSPVAAGIPVSYTHLDVYKRQAGILLHLPGMIAALDLSCSYPYHSISMTSSRSKKRLSLIHI